MFRPSPIFNTDYYYPADQVKLVYSGEDYFEKLIELIRSANSIIHFQTYIFDDDATGIQIATELKKAAAKGVKVYLLIDAFGSKELPHSVIHDLNKNGVYARLFAPFFSKNTINLGRRMHHKIVMADNNTALVGGINISDKYRGTPSQPAWLDYAILVKGNVCEKASKICLAILNRTFPIIPKPIRKKNSNHYAHVRFRQNDSLRGKRQITRGYLKAINNAKTSIIFVSSYFLPGRRILRALKRMARKGVQISIILSAKSDVPLLGKATAHLYVSLMKEGIYIYEWQNSVLHGKIAMVDQHWVTVGSFNLNYLSALSSIELNVEVIASSITSELQKHIEAIIQNGCKKIDFDTYLQEYTWKKKFINTLAYSVTRLFMKGLAIFPRFLSWSKAD